MKLFLVERTDRVTSDEYDSFVVRAKNELDALLICANKTNYNRGHFTRNNTKITELESTGALEIILGSFNAG